MAEIKKIWLVNKYAMPPQYESRLRTIKFAHYLQLKGYEVTIIACSIMHNMGINLIEDNDTYIERKYGNLHFVFLKGLSYKKATGIKRLLSEVRFHYDLVRVAKSLDKPDLIVATTNALISNPVLAWAKHNKIKYITESLDVWPDNFIDFGLVSPNNPLMKYLFWRVKKTYAESDANVFSWYGCYKYFQKKKWDKESGGPIDMSKVYYINNGVDLNDFETNNANYALDDSDLTSPLKKVIYLGSIRLVNHIDQLVKAAELLKERTDVVFLIYGDGDYREHLIKYCENHRLSNIKFKAKWTDPKYVPYILSHSTINVLNYISSDFAKNGISSSKMFQYMASGKPIVCNIDILDCPITKRHIGIAHTMSSPKEYANSISLLLDLPNEEYLSMCERAKNLAKQFDYPYLTKQMISIIKHIEMQ